MKMINTRFSERLKGQFSHRWRPNKPKTNIQSDVGRKSLNQLIGQCSYTKFVVRIWNNNKVATAGHLVWMILYKMNEETTLYKLNSRKRASLYSVPFNPNVYWISCTTCVGSIISTYKHTSIESITYNNSSKMYSGSMMAIHTCGIPRQFWLT